MDKLKVGDLVILKGHEVIMTITNIPYSYGKSRDVAIVVWYDDYNRLEVAELPCKLLSTHLYPDKE